MVTFIKIPLTEHSIKNLNICPYIELHKIEKRIGYITAYPKTEINEKGMVIYPPENKIGFYCKSMKFCDIIHFKGGFNIEKSSKQVRQTQGRKWYFETNQKLPRKVKKNIIGTLK